MNENTKTTEEIAEVAAENEKLVEVLKASAYVLISSFTARKAFLESVNKLKTDGENALFDYFTTEAPKIRAEELKKLQERIAAYA